MTRTTNCMRGGLQRLRARLTGPLLALAVLMAACGGGSGGSTSGNDPQPVGDCDPAGGSTEECGTLLLGLTDADGDFLSYSVDVVSLELQMAGGRTVDVLPEQTRIDFANYVDLTEILAAASVPPGAYVAGTITLDYSAAEIVVESGGDSAEAVVVDADGNPLTQMTFTIQLDDRNQLVITRARSSLLTVDFDLAASHTVDLGTSPAIAVAEPFIVAEIDPVVSKDIRVRGALLAVDADAMNYTVALRPFVGPDGDFGSFQVEVTDETEFEVNGALLAGADGLAALADAGTGTMTIAQGSLDVAERSFTADLVLAGSSVPGNDSDAVIGNVIARSGDVLHVHGATVIRANAAAYFRDDIVVNVGPETRVYKPGVDEPLDAGVISVGQALAVRGDIVATEPGDPLEIDATEGAVRLNRTHLSGIATSVNPGQLDIDLQAVDRRRVSLFDFSGTGPDAASDADPKNYEIATGSLALAQQAVGEPVVVYGFPSDFGTAPPDFEGRTLVDFSDVRSALGIGWGVDGTVAPFLSMGSEGLVLDIDNPDIDGRHYIKQGPVLIDLTTLPSGTVIAPRDDGRSLLAIVSRGSVDLYTNMDDFVAALTTALDGSTTARALYARGHYDSADNRFTAYKIGIYLQQP